MRLLVYSGALLAGVLIGAALVHTVDGAFRQQASPGRSENTATGKTPRFPEVVGVRIGRMISAETEAMREDMPLNKAMDVLFAERKSPLRTRAFLKTRIQTMTRDQLIQAFMNGEIQTKAEIEEATRRLATEDPEGTYDHLVAQDFRLNGMDNLYTFIDALQQTWADVDAPAVMARLQKMKRGGSQQDNSLRFSAYWAKIDPAAAASHFNDLVYLRNMQDQGDMVFTDNAYADQIAKSWKEKDEDGMRKYIAELPAGRERDALEAAANKLGGDGHK
ncbi:MAG: hypothetical protein ABI600_12215 [Luteolibacter sp.]